MAHLRLALKGEYFDAIKAGTKNEEYRMVCPFWALRIEGRDFQRIVLTRGYPSKTDWSRRIVLPWRGYTVRWLTHPLGDKVQPSFQMPAFEQPSGAPGVASDNGYIGERPTPKMASFTPVNEAQLGFYAAGSMFIGYQACAMPAVIPGCAPSTAFSETTGKTTCGAGSPSASAC